MALCCVDLEKVTGIVQRNMTVATLGRMGVRKRTFG